MIKNEITTIKCNSVGSYFALLHELRADSAERGLWACLDHSVFDDVVHMYVGVHEQWRG